MVKPQRLQSEVPFSSLDELPRVASPCHAPFLALGPAAFGAGGESRDPLCLFRPRPGRNQAQDLPRALANMPRVGRSCPGGRFAVGTRSRFESPPTHRRFAGERGDGGGDGPKAGDSDWSVSSEASRRRARSETPRTRSPTRGVVRGSGASQIDSVSIRDYKISAARRSPANGLARFASRIFPTN